MKATYPTLGNANMQKAIDALRPAMAPLAAQVAAQRITEMSPAQAGAAQAIRTIAGHIQSQRADELKAAQFKLPADTLRASLEPRFKLPEKTWQAFEAAQLRASSQVLQAFEAAQVKPSVAAAQALAEALQTDLTKVAMAAAGQESEPAPEPETLHWLLRLSPLAQTELFCVCLVAVLALSPVLEDASAGDAPSVGEILAALVAMALAITKAIRLRQEADEG